MSWNFLATVRLRQRVTKGPGSRAAGVAMAFKLIESAQTRWRAVNAPHLVALARAGAVFKNGKLIERPPTNQRVLISKSRDTPIHAIYERITVAGPEVVGVRLTAAAYAHGLALALPEKVEMARPTGVGRAISTYTIPIEGRDEWLAAAARRLA